MKTPCVGGRTRGYSLPYVPQEGLVSIISESSSKIQPQIQPQIPNRESSKTYAIVGCPLKVKKMTSKDKSNTCKINSQPTESFLTLVPGSTSNAKVCDPSSSWLPKEESDKLWLPIATDCVASHSNWLPGSFKSIKSNSWFSIKKWIPLKRRRWQKTFSRSSTFSIAESTEGVNTKSSQRKSNVRKSKKEIANKSKRVGLKPSPEVNKTLKEWFGSVRATYNWALGCIKAKPNEYKLTNMIWLRKRFVNKCNIPKAKQFLLNTPKSIRDTAVSDLSEAYKSNFLIRAKNPNHTFDINFRKRKEAQSITITSEQIKQWDVEKREFAMFPTMLKNKIKFHLRLNGFVPDKVSYDCKLLMSVLGKFSFVIVFHDPPCESQARSGMCSIDPGVRTFLTIYSPLPGVCYKIGDKDISRIFRLCKHLDRMVLSKTIWRSICRMRNRIKNLVKEVHCKAVKFILKKFSEVILPPFMVSQMVRRANRKIRSKTVRQMMCWSHYTFKQRLQMVAEREGARVYIRGEEYTSKTCSHCRFVKHNLGGAKTYKCTQCNLKADRDCCGSRNIFIKNTKKQSVRFKT